MQTDREEIVIPISKATTSQIKKCENAKRKLLAAHKIIVFIQAITLLSYPVLGNAAIYIALAFIATSMVIFSIIGIYNRRERKLFEEETNHKGTGMRRAIIIPELENSKKENV